MRIRRFEAPDSKTALAMVKAELGDDAVILANRTISAGGGVGRKYGKSMVEVVAAMDYDLYSIAGYSDVTGEQSAAAVQVAVEEDRYVPGRPEPEIPVDKKKVAPPTDEVGLAESVPKVARPNNASGRMPRPMPVQAATIRGTVGGGNDGKKTAFRVEGGRQTAKGRPAAGDVARWREQLIGQIRYDSILDRPGDGQRIVALVGATGVGKTTTDAKIAAHARLHKGLKVALISMDCYRIGATDQLRTYARIMQIPCEVALKEKDLPRLVAMHADCDLIIIDTAGKSPYDDAHVDELSRWLSGVEQVEAYLTISATTKKEDLKAVVDKYRELNPAGLILTKLDETRAYAALCQQLVAGDLPLCCLGVGQRVPEDLVPAGDETAGLLFRQGWRTFSDRLALEPALAARMLAV